MEEIESILSSKKNKKKIYTIITHNNVELPAFLWETHTSPKASDRISSW